MTEGYSYPFVWVYALPTGRFPAPPAKGRPMVARNPPAGCGAHAVVCMAVPPCPPAKSTQGDDRNMKNPFRDFLDNITGVLFTPSASLKKIALEKRVAQSLVILILSGILPDMVGLRRTINQKLLGSLAARDVLPGIGGAYDALARSVPYIAALMTIGAILMIPLLHFIFTAVVELSCQFLAPRKPVSSGLDDAGRHISGGAPGPAPDDAGAPGRAPAPNDVTAADPDGTMPDSGSVPASAAQIPAAPHTPPAFSAGVGLFAAMAFSTLPMVFMVPVNLLAMLAGINPGPLFGMLLRIWVIVLQIISVKEVHGFTGGRAALAYFALPAAGLAVALLLILMLAAFLMPFIPGLP